jgi:gluconolactonase
MTSFHIEKLCTGHIWTEGPIWLQKENAILFSDVKANCQYKYFLDIKKLTVYKAHSNYANGNAIDHRQCIISCSHGLRAITRTKSNGEMVVLVDKLEGKRFNSPNDVVVKSDGTIWFTDPPYGIINDLEGFKAESQIIGCYVYSYNPKLNFLTIATSDTQRPNGLAFSPDESKLYVADMSIVDFPTQGRCELRVYDIVNNQALNGQTFCIISPGIPDGLCVDDSGNIYCSCEDGVIILNSSGQKIGKILIEERVSNCTLGQVDKSELYITATTSLYRVKIK